MNTTFHDYDDQGADFKVEFRRREADANQSSESSRAPSYRRTRTKGPLQHNGIHRRRRTRMNW